MEFTGERFIPELEGEIKYEHLHRYALAMDLAAGKAVLDIATGEGYGAALLGQVARFVVGVDIDSEIIQHARQRYLCRNLSFCVGSCAAIPLSDNSIDLVSSFETIEHHEHHDKMMEEIKRVLKPSGILILSSPNRLTYSDGVEYNNPYHIKELYYEELCELLSRHFRYQYIYGQRLAAGSFVFPLEDLGVNCYQAYTGNSALISRKICRLASPTYFIAVCSDDAVVSQQPTITSIYLDRDDDLTKSP
jgi:SAM-dependent methyltransferase